MRLNLNVRSAINASNELLLNNDVGLSIKGRVKELGNNIPCRVRLHEKLSGRLIFEKLTDNVGNYSFNHLTANKFFVVAHHPLNTYNAVIADLVVPK